MSRFECRQVLILKSLDHCSLKNIPSTQNHTVVRYRTCISFLCLKFFSPKTSNFIMIRNIFSSMGTCLGVFYAFIHITKNLTQRSVFGIASKSYIS